MTTVVRKLTIFHIIVGILTACGGRGSGSDTAKTPADATFKVALLTPGPISDQGWNGSAYAGLMRVKDSLGAQTSHIQTKTPAEFEENFRQYGSSGYALVFGHGFEFQDAARQIRRTTKLPIVAAFEHEAAFRLPVAQRGIGADDHDTLACQIGRDADFKAEAWHGFA